MLCFLYFYFSALLRQTSKRSKFLKMAFEQVLFQVKRFTKICLEDEYDLPGEPQCHVVDSDSKNQKDETADIDKSGKGCGLCCLIHKVVELSQVFLCEAMKESPDHVKTSKKSRSFQEREESTKILTLLLIL